MYAGLLTSTSLFTFCTILMMIGICYFSLSKNRFSSLFDSFLFFWMFLFLCTRRTTPNFNHSFLFFLFNFFLKNNFSKKKIFSFQIHFHYMYNVHSPMFKALLSFCRNEAIEMRGIPKIFISISLSFFLFLFAE